jgi:hypothetical protein
MNRSPLPNLHRGWAHPAHICTGTNRVVGAHEQRSHVRTVRRAGFAPVRRANAASQQSHAVAWLPIRRRCARLVKP